MLVEAHEELRVFIDNYRLKGVLDQGHRSANLKKSFKKIYPILIFERSLSKTKIWKDSEKTDSFRLYFKETLSDILQSIVLAVQGLYKPALLILRSAVENFVKCIGIAQGQAVLSLTSVYELLDVVRDTKFISGDLEAKRAYQGLKAEYASLCGYVHTSTSAHMALNTIVGKFPRYSASDEASFFKKTMEIGLNITKLLILLFMAHFKSLHHRHFDVVCDALPASFKRHLAL